VSLCVAALLAGCQSNPQKEAGIALQDHHLQRIPHWEAEGKIAVQMAGEHQSASFKWTQDKGNYVVHLFGPFGQGATWLRRTQRGVTLENNAKTGRHRAASAEALMQDVMGWQVPVSNLQFWLRGLPAKQPKPTQAQRDSTGVLTHLEQEGWQVDYTRHDNFAGWSLPTKIIATRDDIRLTVVVKRWQLPTAPR